MRQHVAVEQLVHEIQPGAAGQQVAAIGAAVVARRHRLADRLAQQRGSNGNAAAKRLADRDQIGIEAEHGRVERVARAAEAALHLVGDDQRAGPGDHGPDGRDKRRRQRPHPALALNRLHDDGRRLVGHRGIKRRRIGRVHKRHTRDQRFERLAIMRVRRNRQGPERAPVEGSRQRDKPGPLPVAPGVPVAARELQARLHRFGAAVAEKRALEPRQPRELLRQFGLIRMEEQIRRVDQGRGLLRQHLGQTGIRMAQAGHPHARREVEVVVALGVPHTGALPAHEHDRRALVGLQHVPCFGVTNLDRRRSWSFQQMSRSGHHARAR